MTLQGKTNENKYSMVDINGCSLYKLSLSDPLSETITKIIPSCLFSPSSIKRKWSISFNNRSTSKLICDTTYLWMFYYIDTFSYVLLFLIISALVLALQQKKGMAQCNFWKYPKISMFHMNLLAPNLNNFLLHSLQLLFVSPLPPYL